MDLLSLIIIIGSILAVIAWWRSGSKPGAGYRNFKLPSWLRYSLVAVGATGLVIIAVSSLQIVDKALGISRENRESESATKKTLKIPSNSVTTFLKNGEELDLENTQAIVTIFGYRNAVDAIPDSAGQLVVPAADFLGRGRREKISLEGGPEADIELKISNVRLQGGNLWMNLNSTIYTGTGSRGRGGGFTIGDAMAKEVLTAHELGSGGNRGAIPVVQPRTDMLVCLAFAHTRDPLQSVPVDGALELYKDSSVYREAWGDGYSAFALTPDRSHQRDMPSGLGLMQFLNPFNSFMLVVCCFFVSLALPFQRALSFCAILVAGIFLIGWVDKTALEKSIAVLEDTELPATQRELATGQITNTFFWKERAKTVLQEASADASLDARVSGGARSAMFALREHQ